MSQRLPVVGSDDDTWGTVLNGFLAVSHNSDGTLASGVVGTTQIASGAVGTNQLATSAVTASQISAGAVGASAIATGSVTATLLSSAVQASLALADTAVQTSALGAASGVATLNGSSQLTSSQLPSGIPNVGSPSTGQSPQWNGSSWVGEYLVTQGTQITSVKDEAYGAKGNALRINDAAMTSGNDYFTTSSWATFEAGMIVDILGATGSESLTNNCLRGVVQSTSSGGVVLNATCGATVSGTQVDYGWNDGPAIQDAVDAISAAGGGTVIIPPGIYLVDVNAHANLPGQVNITGYNGMTYGVLLPGNVNVWGYGATLRCPYNALDPSDNATVFGISDNTGPIAVQGVSFDGCGPNPLDSQIEHNVFTVADGSVDVTIRDCYAVRFFGNFALVMGADPQRTRILDCTITQMGQHFAQIGGSTSTTIRGCMCYDTTSGGAESIILGGNGGTCTNVIVDDFRSYSWGTAVFCELGAVSGAVISHVRCDEDITLTSSDNLVNIDIHDCTVDYISVGNGSGTTVQGVKIHHNHTGTISIGASGVTYIDCEIDSNTVNSDTFSPSPNPGILAAGAGTSTNVSVTNNKVNGGSLTVDPGVANCSGNVIICPVNGVGLQINGSGMTVVGNSVISASSGSSSEGAPMQVAGNQNTVTGNTVTQTQAGTGPLYVSGSQNMISGNTLINSTSGANSVFRDSGTSNSWIGNQLIFNYGSGAYIQLGGSTTPTIRSNLPINAQGSVSVGVPSSGTAVAVSAFDRTFYVTGASGGSTSLSIGGGYSFGTALAVTVPASTTIPVSVPAACTLTPTYGAGNAPTWSVYQA